MVFKMAKLLLLHTSAHCCYVFSADILHIRTATHQYCHPAASAKYGCPIPGPAFNAFLNVFRRLRLSAGSYAKYRCLLDSGLKMAAVSCWLYLMLVAAIFGIWSKNGYSFLLAWPPLVTAVF